MDTCTLVVLVALFLGVMGIIVMLDRRRRTESGEFEQLQRTLAAIHSTNQAQLAQVTEAVSQLRVAVEAGTKSSQEQLTALLSEAARTAERAVVRLESALLRQQEAQDAAIQSAAAKFCGVAESSSKELLAEAQRATKAVKDFQVSMEASVDFRK
jgi:hypothetical protein